MMQHEHDDHRSNDTPAAATAAPADGSPPEAPAPSRQETAGRTSLLRKWYEEAARAGFLFLRMKKGWNKTPAKGWNKPGKDGAIKETPDVSRHADVALSWLRSGDNVGIGCGERCGIVDIDAPDAAHEIQSVQTRHGHPSTLMTMTPRGLQLLYTGERAVQLPQTQGDRTAIPGVDTRAALKGYGMGPGSVRTAASYSDGKRPPGDGPWTYAVWDTVDAASDLPIEIGRALFPLKTDDPIAVDVVDPFAVDVKAARSWLKRERPTIEALAATKPRARHGAMRSLVASLKVRGLWSDETHAAVQEAYETCAKHPDDNVHDPQRQAREIVKAASSAQRKIDSGEWTMVKNRGIFPNSSARADPEPGPEPEPVQAPPEDVKAILDEWQATEAKQAMPLPALPETLPGRAIYGYDQPVDSWELAHHWARAMHGTWRCEIEKKSYRWLRFSLVHGWRPHAREYVLNEIKNHGREHFFTYVEGRGGKEGQLVENPHAGSNNSIAKPAEESARALEGVALAPGIMDADPFKTGLPGGKVIEARSREIVQSDVRQMVAKQAGAEPGPWEGREIDKMTQFHAPCPLERMWLGCYIGRALLGGRDREGLFIPGEKWTAKTTFIEAVRSAFGDDYAMAVDVDTLIKRPGKGGGSVHTQDSTKAQMIGKRLLTLNESEEGSALNARAVKQLISDDRITGRLMSGGNTVQVDPTWSFLFGFNWEDFPTLDPNDDAAWDRIVVLPFDVPLSPEKRISGFLRVLQQPEELSATVGWILHHGWLWADHGMPPKSRRMVDAARRMREASVPPFERFLREHTKPGPGMLFSNLRRSFSAWCRDQGDPMDLSAKAMAVYLRKRDGTTVKEAGGRWLMVYGIELEDGSRFAAT